MKTENNFKLLPCINFSTCYLRFECFLKEKGTIFKTVS